MSNRLFFLNALKDANPDWLTSKATIIGGAVVAAVFLYKWVSGWLYTNLQVSLTTRRQPVRAGEDLLIVTIQLEKGAVDAVRLQYVGVRVTPRAISGGKSSDDSSYDKIDTGRLALVGDVPQWELMQPVKTFALSPNDSVHFETFFHVKTSEVYRVELFVAGPAALRPTSDSQWRASAISTPRE
jgi:hypothetical protein